MNRTIKAYKLLFSNNLFFSLSLIGSVVFIIISSYKVLVINENILDSILSIVSILFPLIAGFLTFGRDLIKDLNEKIESIKEVANNKAGEPTTDYDKRRIVRMKNLASNFKSVIISTFYISFILIIYVLIAKFNNFDFKTSELKFDQIKVWDYISKNVINFILKALLFTTLYTLFLNLTYLVYFIVEVNKDEKFD